MLSRMTVGQKILASFAFAFVLLLTMGAVVLVGAGRMSGSIENLGHRKLPTLEALAELDEAKTAADRGISA